MNIKHLVISGGGPVLFQIIASIQHLEECKLLDMSNIQSIYATSAGALLGVILCLKFDWETINDYIIKRPWHEVFTIKIQNILEVYNKKGLFDIKSIEKCLKPLFDAKDLSIDLSLEELYILSNIELHLFSFEINEYKVEDISYLTHPKLSVLTAIQMTCGIPVLLSPVCIDNKCFIDGGVACNYPLNYCINSGKNPDEILGFKNFYSDDTNNNINNESNLIDFLLGFLFKAVFSTNTDNSQPSIKYELLIDTKCLSLETLRTSLSNAEVRKELFESGKKNTITFIEKLHNLENSI
jgi:predicted acylesterase/phospholipase RssA